MSGQYPKLLKVKVNNNDDTRLWRAASPNNFEGLCSFITTTWNNTNFIAQYCDDEGDLITIASPQDLKDAFDFANSENKKSLKIYVQNTQKHSSQTQTLQNDEPLPEPEPEPELEEKQEPKQFNSIHEMAFDFLTNIEIINLLPQMFGNIIQKLNEKNNNLSENEIIEIINNEIINDKQFGVIVRHPLFITYGPLTIPFIANKIFGQQSLYKHFKLETIKVWIKQVLEMFGNAIKQMQNGKCKFKDIVIDIQYPPKTDDGRVIHFGVECDLCSEYPIIGDRYKCNICENWDCCSKCEPKHDHPLTKYKKCAKTYQNSAFKGLNEIIQKLSQQQPQPQPQPQPQQPQQQEPQQEQKEDIDIYDEMVVDCICGSKMDCIIAKNAYNKCNTIFCDVCAVQLFDEMVYHCPKNKDPNFHKNGYDLCQNCANKKVETDKLNEEQLKEKEEPIVKEEEPIAKEEIEEFEYKSKLIQIKQIMNYGSENDEMIKQMLIEHKGDIAKVVPLLLQ